MSPRLPEAAGPGVSRAGKVKLALVGVLTRRWFILRFPPIVARRSASMLFQSNVNQELTACKPSRSSFFTSSQ